MTAPLVVDTDALVAAAQTWARWGDGINRAQLELRRDLAVLRLDGDDVVWLLADSATQLWTTSAFAARVVDIVIASDSLGVTLGPWLVSRLRREAGMGAARVFSPGTGDLGGTYRAEIRSPYLLAGDDDLDRGRELVVRALTDTARNDRIRVDEFEVVRMSDGRYVVVLPGVTDLSSPDLGLDGASRTVRDLDQGAVGSFGSTSVTDNPYAAMVAQALAVRGVPRGSEFVVVGHSYGADTALDLAADPSFNGPAGFRVTHAIAAGYHSQPQLAHVPASTEVLVLQNRRDAAVLAERAGRGVLDGVLDGGVVPAALDVALGLAELAGGSAVGVRSPRPGQTVAVFAGGGTGAGHHPDNYVGYVAATRDPAVTAFLASLGAGSVAVAGDALAIDVSIPT